MLDWWEGSDRRRVLREELRRAGRRRSRRRHPEPGARAEPRAHQHGDLPAGQPGAGGLGDQEHGDRPVGGGRRRRLPQGRPGPRLHPRARRDRGHQGAGAGPARGGRRPGPDLPGTPGRRDGGDLPDHRRPQAPFLGQARGGADRRPLLGSLDRGLHRPRRSRGPGRRADRQGARRRPDPDRRGPDSPGGERRPGRPRGHRGRGGGGDPHPRRPAAAPRPGARPGAAGRHATVGGAPARGRGDVGRLCLRRRTRS